MITNEKQYLATRNIIERLRVSLDSVSLASKDVHPDFIKAHRAGIASQLQELEADVTLYEKLRSGVIRTFEAKGLQDLPDVLIQARIARGMSQKDLAEFLGLKEQQVQRYEADRYRSASLDRLIEVASALGIEWPEGARLRGSSQLKDTSESSFSAFPIAEMYKRGWFEDFEGTLSQARKSADVLIPAFFREAHTFWAGQALHRKSVRTTGQVHEAVIAAWEARVIMLANRNPPSIQFDRRRLSKEWLGSLVNLSSTVDGPKKAIAYLREAGIVLVVERQLPGSLLDGAALLTSQNIPTIGLTLRHDRLDNFWFTLLHEIGHLALHIGEGEYQAIFDDTESPARSKVEQEADYFAQEALLPTSVWNISVSRFSQSERSVVSDSKRFGISPSIIAGRIRREADNYTILRSLVGAGEVRRQFGL